MKATTSRLVYPLTWTLLAGGATACAPDDPALAVAGSESVMTNGRPWTDGRLTYYLDTSGALGPTYCRQTSTVKASGIDAISAIEHDNTHEAIDRYDAYTPLRFEEVFDLSDPDTVIFTKRTRGTSSHANTSGQPDRDDPDSGFYQSALHPCVFMRGNVDAVTRREASADGMAHELGHTIGMPHEQNRYDRLNYIDLNLDCVAFVDADSDNDNDNLSAFDRMDDPPAMAGPYDYRSIMQYSSRGKICSGAGCPADCGVTRWPIERQCDSANPFWPFAGGCDVYIDDNDDFSSGDINVIFRRYERALGNNEAGDKLGAAMVTGDFDGDGYLDLAVGAPGEKRPINGVQRATGLVFLWRGTSERLVAWKTIASPSPVEGGKFGAAVAAGDLDGDGADELVVGAPGEHQSGAIDGRVHIYRSDDKTELGNHTVPRHFGLGSTPWKTIDHLSVGVLAQGSEIGAALAVGNFNGTGGADLAIGAPAGGLYGTAAGFVIIATGFEPGSTTQYRTLSQVGLSTERAGERFGAALAGASLHLARVSSLIVGAPETGIGGFGSPGRAYVFAGGSSMTPVQELAATTTTLSAFGSAIAVANTANGAAIAIGSPGEDGTRGRVHVYRTGGLWSPFPLSLAQTLAHPTGMAVAGDRLGEVLAAVRVSGNTTDTLVAGLPRRDAPSATDSGAYVRFNSTAAGASVPLSSQGTLVDNPSPGTSRRFGSSVATAGAYDPTLGTFVERRVAVGSDGAEGGAGSFRVRNDSGGWDLFHQETAHPE